MLVQKRKLVPCQWPHCTQFGRDDPGDFADFRAFPSSGGPGSRHCVAKVKSLDGIREVAHEVAPAKLSVSVQLKPKLLLLVQYIMDVLVFQRLQAAGIVHSVAASLYQLLGTQKTSDVIG